MTDVTTANAAISAERASPRARKREALVSAASLALFAGAVANVYAPVLRLATLHANQVAGIAALALPWVALVVGQRVLAGWRRVVHVVVLAPILLLTLPAGACALLDADDTAGRGMDANFVPIR